MRVGYGLRSALFLWIVLGLPASAQSLARFLPAETDSGACRLGFVLERTTGAERQPWPASDCGWLFVRQEGTQWNFDALAPQPGDASVLQVELEGPGPALVGWDRPPRIERTTAAELRAFLAQRAGGKALPREIEGLEASTSVALARAESLMLVARPGTAGGEPAAVVLSKTGQRMELRSMLDPSALPAGSDFAFKLYLPEGGADNVFCRAVQLEGRAAEVLERLPDGSLRAKLEPAGPWMIEAHRVRVLDGAGGATHELASVTLVFVVRPAAARQGGGR